MKAGDKVKIDYLESDGKTIHHSEIKTIKTLEHYNKDSYFVSFKETQGNYIFTKNALNYMLN